jgi:hypothetical protein
MARKLPIKPKFYSKFKSYTNLRSFSIILIPKFRISKLSYTRSNNVFWITNIPKFTIQWLAFEFIIGKGTEREWAVYLNHRANESNSKDRANRN